MKNKKNIIIIASIILLIFLIFLFITIYVCVKINNVKTYNDIVKIERNYIYKTTNPLIKKINKNMLINYVFRNKEWNDDYVYMGDYYDKIGTDEYLDKKEINTVPSKEKTIELLSIYFKDKNNIYLIPTERINYKNITEIKNLKKYNKYSYKIEDINFYFEEYKKKDYDSDNFDDVNDSFEYDEIDETKEEHIVISLRSNKNKKEKISLYIVNNGEKFYVHNYNSISSIFDTEVYYDFMNAHEQLLVSSNITNFVKKYNNHDKELKKYLEKNENTLVTNLKNNIIGTWKAFDDSGVSYSIDKKYLTIFEYNENDNYLKCEYKKKDELKDALGLSTYYNFQKNGLMNQKNINYIYCDDYDIVLNGKTTKNNGNISLLSINNENEKGIITSTVQLKIKYKSKYYGSYNDKADIKNIYCMKIKE